MLSKARGRNHLLAPLQTPLRSLKNAKSLRPSLTGVNRSVLRPNFKILERELFLASGNFKPCIFDICRGEEKAKLKVKKYVRNNRKALRMWMKASKSTPSRYGLYESRRLRNPGRMSPPTVSIYTSLKIMKEYKTVINAPFTRQVLVLNEFNFSECFVLDL